MPRNIDHRGEIVETASRTHNGYVDIARPRHLNINWSRETEEMLSSHLLEQNALREMLNPIVEAPAPRDDMASATEIYRQWINSANNLSITGLPLGSLNTIYGDTDNCKSISFDTTVKSYQFEDNNGNKIVITGDQNKGYSIEIEGDVKIVKGKQILLDF